MAYCTRDDVLAQITEGELFELTDDGGDSGLLVTDGGGLDADYSAGWCRVGGTRFTISAGSVACADDDLSFIYVDDAGAVQAATTLPAGAHFDLALVETAAGAIVRIDDLRTTVETDALVAALADADAEIDTYIGMRHPVPLDPVPSRVKALSVDVTIYNLHKRRGLVMTQDNSRRAAYRDAVSFLRDIAAGKASLGVGDPDTPPSDADKAQVTSAEQIFSRDKMRGF